MVAIFDWLEHSALAAWINNSTWAFAAVEAGHLLALAVIGGAVLVVDLRVFGWVFKGQPVSAVARDARPWLVWSVVAMIVTGLPLFASLAVSRYYVNEAFRLKMYFFAAAILFTFTIRQAVVSSARMSETRLAKIVAATSICLWSAVGFLGRAIGFI